MGSVSHIEAAKVKMTEDLCQVARLQVLLVNVEGGGIIINNTTKYYFITKVKE